MRPLWAVLAWADPVVNANLETIHPLSVAGARAECNAAVYLDANHPLLVAVLGGRVHLCVWVAGVVLSDNVAEHSCVFKTDSTREVVVYSRVSVSEPPTSRVGVNLWGRTVYLEVTVSSGVIKQCI